MNSDILNSFGLGSDILAGIVLFFFGPPQPSLEEGVGLGLSEGTVLQSGITVSVHNAQVRRLRAKHLMISRVALLLLALGFFLQLVAVWV